MASIGIAERIYNNPETGETVPYKRLVIAGKVGEEDYALELKLVRTELMAVKMILANAEGEMLEIKPDAPF